MGGESLISIGEYVFTPKLGSIHDKYRIIRFLKTKEFA